MPTTRANVTDESGELNGIDVRVGHFDFGGGEEVGFDFRAVEVRVVKADGLRRVKAVQVDQLTTGGGIDEDASRGSGRGRTRV